MKTNPLLSCKNFFISPETHNPSKKGIATTITGTALGAIGLAVGTLALLTIFHYLPKENPFFSSIGTVGIQGSTALVATGGTLLSAGLITALILGCRRKKTIEETPIANPDEGSSDKSSGIGKPSEEATKEVVVENLKSDEESSVVEKPSEETRFIEEKLNGEAIPLVAGQDDPLKLVAEARSYLNPSEVFVFKRLNENDTKVWMIVRPPTEERRIVVTENENALNVELLSTLTVVTPTELEARKRKAIKEAGLKSAHLEMNHGCYHKQEQVFIVRECDPPKIRGIPKDLHYIVAPLEQAELVRNKLINRGLEIEEIV